MLRLRPGELVTASDGAGGLRRCRFVGDAGIEPDGDADHQPPPRPPVTIAFALTKGDKPELVVQKLTELGVDHIVPFVGARSVVRWDHDKAGRNVERWQRVAREAAMQSRRRFLPTVASVAASVPVGFALAHPGGGRPTLAQPAVAVGPEGGWGDDELAAATATVDLGPTTLRAETAAVTAGAILCALRNGLVRPRDDLGAR